MKNLINIIVLFSIFVLAVSCRNNDIPEDIHEHDEIERLEVTLTNKNDVSDVQTIQYIGGVADKTISLKEGNVYVVNLDFQLKHDDHYHSANDEILEEKDEHFITYEFGNITTAIKRIGVDETRADGNKVGLVTEWNVGAVSAGAQVNIKLLHLPVTVQQDFPSPDNQQGKTTGGESDVNAFLKIIKN